MSNKYRTADGAGLNAGNAVAVGAISRVTVLVAFLAGPVLWSLHLLISEILISSACSYGPNGFRQFTVAGIAGWQLVLLLVSIVFICIVVIADVIAIRAWRRSHVGLSVTGAAGGTAGRNGWMALAGVLLSTMFLMGILAAFIPIFWLSGCV